MTWYLHVEGQSRLPLAPGISVTIGRAEDCDVRIEGTTRVSRRHLEVQILEGGEQWRVTDVSANGSVGYDGRFTSLEGSGQLVLLLGASDGPLVVLSVDRSLDPSSVPRPDWDRGREDQGANTGTEPPLQGLRIGRDPDNDIIISSLLASPHHARLVLEGTTATILDLNSSRGTFINGRRIKQHLLRAGDVLSIGGQSFQYMKLGALEPLSPADGVPMTVRDITVMAGEKRLLADVSFDVPPRSLIAVIGPSGSGKSTMLGALTGLSPAAGGQVLLDGQDLYSSYDDWRFRIGFVPQQDLVPAQLSVRQALTYAARLRFPKDTTESERQERIAQVLNDLRLTDRADLRIDRLSGGQRKRVSVALELLTRPPVLFLDEPTSGLDPGLDQQLMMLLRELANDGRTVLVVTHAMDNLHLCDQVIVLAAPGMQAAEDQGGGRLAYIGPPSEALQYFEADDWAGVFLALESRSGADWARRFRDRRTDYSVAARVEGKNGSVAVSKPGSPVRQWFTLLGRTWTSVVADRSYAALLVLLPLVLAALGFLVGSSAGLGPNGELQGLNPDARILLLVLILGASFTGAATTIGEFVKERVIYRRERAVGMSRTAYVLSKALILGAIAGAQGVLFALLTLVGRPGASNAFITGWGHLDVALVVGLLAATSAMLGLALSAVIPTREGTLPILVIVTMLQVVLSGAIPLRWAAIDATVGLAVPAYWAFEALAALVNLSALLGQGSVAEWGSTGSDVAVSVLVLAGMAIAFVLLAILLLKRSDPGRRA